MLLAVVDRGRQWHVAWRWRLRAWTVCRRRSVGPWQVFCTLTLTSYCSSYYICVAALLQVWLGDACDQVSVSPGLVLSEALWMHYKHDLYWLPVPELIWYHFCVLIFWYTTVLTVQLHLTSVRVFVGRLALTAATIFIVNYDNSDCLAVQNFTQSLLLLELRGMFTIMRLAGKGMWAVKLI